MAQETQSQIYQRIRGYDNLQLLKEFIRFKSALNSNFPLTNHQYYEYKELESILFQKLYALGFLKITDSLSRT